MAVPREAGITTSKNGSNFANRDKEIKTSRGKRTSSKETLHLTQSHSSEEEALFQEEVSSMLAKQAVEKTTPKGRSFL